MKLKINLTKKQKNTIFLVLFVLFVLLAIFFRGFYLKRADGDFTTFITYWYGYFDLKGFKGLATNNFDYAPLYLTFICLFSYLPFSRLIMTKCLSYFFEILLAVLTYKYISSVNKKDSREFKLFLSSCVLILPTMILNTGWWCQCDIIYTFFVILALYFYHRERITDSFISLGIAFAFKLQFIFILPLFIILYFRDKKIKWYQFLYIPLVNIACSIPAFCCGYTLKQLYNVYFTQTTEYTYRYSMYMNNIYELFNFGEPVKHVFYIMVGLTILLFACLLGYCILKKIKFDNRNMMLLGVLSVMICVYFLPCMHERYLYVADVLSVIYFLIYRRGFFQALFINLTSFFCYDYFVFQIIKMKPFIGSVIFLLLIINQFLMFRSYSLKRSKNGLKRGKK